MLLIFISYSNCFFVVHSTRLDLVEIWIHNHTNFRRNQETSHLDIHRQTFLVLNFFLFFFLLRGKKQKQKQTTDSCKGIRHKPEIKQE